MRLTVDIPDDVARGRPADELAREIPLLVVLDAYRSGAISSGRAARLLGMGRVAFLDFASSRGIATANYDADDFARELFDIASRGF